MILLVCQPKLNLEMWWVMDSGTAKYIEARARLASKIYAREVEMFLMDAIG